MVASFALLAGTVYLFTMIPKGFLPSEDQGRFNVTVEGIQGIGFDDLVRHQFEVTDIIGQGSGYRRFQQQRRRRRRRQRRRTRAASAST